VNESQVRDNSYVLGTVAALIVIGALLGLLLPEKIKAMGDRSSFIEASGRIETRKVTVSVPIISSKVSIDLIAAGQQSENGFLVPNAVAKKDGGTNPVFGEPVGSIKQIFVKEGDRISKGQKLMVLDDAILRLKVQKSEAALEEAKANREILDEQKNDANKGLKDLKKAIRQMEDGIGQMKQKENELEDAIEAMGQLQTPPDLSTSPPADIAQSPEELQKALNELRSQRIRLESQLRKIKAQRSTLNSAIEKLESAEKPADVAVRIAEIDVDMSRKELEKTVIVAPIAGVVTKQNTEESEVVFPNQPLFTIEKTKVVDLNLYLPEDEARLVKKGQTAIIAVDSYPDREFKSVISHVEDFVEFAPTNLSTDRTHLAHTRKVSVEIRNDAGIFKDGMPADAEIVD